MLSSNLEKTLREAYQLASNNKHEYVTLEHLLLALLDDKDAISVLKACAVDTNEIKISVENFILKDLENLKENFTGEPKLTNSFQRVIQRAAIHVQSSGRTEVTGANVLVAMFAERESNAAYFLQDQNMTRYDAVNFIAHGVAKNTDYDEARSLAGSDQNEDNLEKSAEGVEDSKKESALEKYCVDLNQKAEVGDIDPLIGRDHEVESCLLYTSDAADE
mgnify:CR=1 FL=1